MELIFSWSSHTSFITTFWLSLLTTRTTHTEEWHFLSLCLGFFTSFWEHLRPFQGNAIVKFPYFFSLAFSASDVSLQRHSASNATITIFNSVNIIKYNEKAGKQAFSMNDLS